MRAIKTVLGMISAVALLSAAACGSAPTTGQGHSSPTATTDSLGDAAPRIEVTYEAHGRSSEGPYRAHAVLIAAGPKHVRYEMRSTGYPPMAFIYDGQRLLVHDPSEFRPWSLFEAPEEHPDMFGTVSGVLAAPDSAEFAKGCRSATEVGHKRILGRTAVGYHCAAHFLADGSGTSAYTAWLDEKTHVLLQGGGFHATSFEEHPSITAATFSTKPPAGAEVEVYAAQKRPGHRAPNFELKRVTGSRAGDTVRLSDYAHRPLVLAFFASDLAFDTTGETCHGCVHSLLTLQRLTDGGTDPAVLAIQEGEVGKPGLPLVPDGLEVDVVNDSGLDVQHSYGLSELIGFVFIGSDGRVQHAFDRALSDHELSEALDELH